MFILPVGLSVVTDDPVCVGWWSTSAVWRSDLSVKSIVKSREETLSEIHVTNWVDSLWEVNTSWKLTVSMSPVVLNTFHVPLVDNDYDFLLWTLIDSCKEVLIFLIDKYSLEFWEEDIHRLNVPIHQVLITALFRKLRWLRVWEPSNDIIALVVPENLILVL